MKVTVVGAGHVGATCAQRIAEGDIADVYLVDIVEGLAAGKALDMAQAAPLVGHSRRISGGAAYEPAEGSAVVVITAGVARKPGMSRDDLLQTNGRIVTGIVAEISRVTPDAIIVMVTNPLDVTTHIAMQVSGLPRQRVIGMAGALDSARFRAFIAMELGCSPVDVQAMVLGGHGDSMVPLPRHATVGGVPVTELVEAGRLEEIVQRTRDGGAEIVALLKTGSAFYAPSAGVTDMVASIVRDEGRVLPASVLLRGEYGIEDTFVGVPVRLGSGGVEEIIEVELTDGELAALQASAAHVRETVQAWEGLK
ncbi:MAG TPA: malate dehydrogenase [Armatimonadota bacterium]|nr:malate dehydrogenase [Armatimonadota bacterium]